MHETDVCMLYKELAYRWDSAQAFYVVRTA